MDKQVNKLIESLEKLTGKKVVLQEGTFNSLSQLDRAFKSRDFKPTGSDFNIGQTKYTWSNSKPDNVSLVDLLKSKNVPITLAYSCTKGHAQLTFTWKIIDGMLTPSKIVIERLENDQQTTT